MDNSDLIRQAFAEGRNATEAVLAEQGELTEADIELIYDLQAGRYAATLGNPQLAWTRAKVLDEYAEILAPLAGERICEVGVGEATSLAGLYQRLPGHLWSGFDLSTKRAEVAQAFLAALGIPAEIWVDSFLGVNRPDESYDIVYSSHSLEPNRGKESEALAELARIARRYVILFEPCYELASPEAQQRMDRLGYVRGLAETAEKVGLKVQEPVLLKQQYNDLNPTACYLCEK